MNNSNDMQNILDECLERLLIKGESIEQCLNRYPDYADELKPLLNTFITAREITSVEPRPDFMARARYEFRAELQELKSNKARRFFGWQPAWVATVASVITFILASGITVGASSNSMPDQVLYPVKVAVEQLQLTVTRSPVSKVELYAELADRRVDEIVYLASKNNPDAIETTNKRLDTNLEKIAILTEAQNVISNEGDVIPAVPEVLSEQAQPEEAPMMSARAPQPPEVATGVEQPDIPKLQKAPPPELSLEKAAEREDTRIIQPQNLEDTDKIRAIIARYARYHPEKLREALEKAPPPVREALLEAIKISEMRYEEAKQALEDNSGNTGNKDLQKPISGQTRSGLIPQKKQIEQSNIQVESATQLHNEATNLINRIQHLKGDRARLGALLAWYQKNQPEVLRSALEKAPPSIKPWLHQAITGSQAKRNTTRAIID